MSKQVNVLGVEELKKRLAQYLEQQPASTQASDRLMKRLELASLILPVAAVVAAIVVIARSASLAEGAVWTALFAIPGSLSLWLFLVGVHTVIIWAFPPVEFMLGMKGTSRWQGFYTGQPAVRWGVYVMVGAVAGAALWGMGAYAFLNPDILTVLIPCIIVFSVGLGLWGTWLQKQTV